MKVHQNSKVEKVDWKKYIWQFLLPLGITLLFFFFSYQIYVNRSHSVTLLFFVLCVIYSVFIIGYIFFSWKEYRRKANIKYLKLQKDAAARQEQLIRLSQQQLERQMTEVLSQLRGLDRLLINGKTVEAQKACRQLSSSFQSSHYTHYCNNEIVDVIFHHKEMECRHLGISFSCHIILPEKMNLSAPTLISLFFNLLNNGIEGCEASEQDSPFLRISVNFEGDFLLIHMENSKNPDVSFDRKTTKGDDFSHGFGLSILEELSRRHNGSCRWLNKGNLFISELMIQYHE